MTIEALDQLEVEIARVARRPRRGSRRKLVAVAAAMSLCAAGAAAATVLDRDDPLIRMFDADDKALVLSGTDSRGKGWQVVTGRKGESFCMTMRNDPVAPGAHATSSAQCGGITPGTLEATLGGSGVAFAYGTVPDEAAEVVLDGDGGSSVAIVADDEHGLPGRFFAAEIPPADRDDVVVTVRDASGAEIAAEGLRELVRRSSPY